MRLLKFPLLQTITQKNINGECKPVYYLHYDCKQNILEVRHIKRWVAPTLYELKRRRDKIGPEPLQPRSSFLEWNYDAEVYAFGKRLGEEFDPKLLRQALVHKSYISKQSEIENSVSLNDNLELIKVGEQFIADCITEDLGKKYPDDIVKAIECYLMSDDMLAHIAVHIGLKDIVLTQVY